jgi:hypothetical protein
MERIKRYFPAICIALLLFFTYRLYNHAYLTLDDFNNLYWVQQANATEMVAYVLNPLSRYFRPGGMFFYWLELHFFDLNAVAYHWTAWVIHGINTLLVYFVVKRCTDSRSGATVGAMLFASQANFANIYWNFGTIFDLVAGCAFFIGILLWMKDRRGWARVLGCTLVFVFAVKAKEMAFTLPAIWFLSDVLLQEKVRLREAAQALFPATVAILLGILKFFDMRQTRPTDLYFMDVRWITLGRGMSGYFNSIFDAGLRWQYWTIAFVVLFLIFAFRRNRPAIFFQAYLLITFLPVIFLINHRDGYLSYIPFLGICGLAALLVKWLTNTANTYIGARRAELAAYAVVPLLCWGTYIAQKHGSEDARAWQRGISADYRAFVLGMRTLPHPPSNETVFFDSEPPYFDEGVLRNATQVALRRTDIDAKLVSTFPDGARYKLRYRDSKVTRLD